MTPTKQQCEWLVYSPESPLTDMELRFGCRVRIGEDVYTYGDVYEMCEVARWNECYLTTFDIGCGCCSSPESVRIKVGPGGDSLGDFKILGNPILLGNVLSELWIMGKYDVWFDKVEHITYQERLLDLWLDCDLTLSLQQILSQVQWKEEEIQQEEIKALFKLLLELFNPKGV